MQVVYISWSHVTVSGYSAVCNNWIIFPIHILNFSSLSRSVGRNLKIVDVISHSLVYFVADHYKHFVKFCFKHSQGHFLREKKISFSVNPGWLCQVMSFSLASRMMNLSVQKRALNALKWPLTVGKAYVLYSCRTCCFWIVSQFLTVKFVITDRFNIQERRQ